MYRLASTITKKSADIEKAPSLNYSAEISSATLWSETVERAECEQSSEYGLVYYLSPAEIVRNQKFNSRSFKARFSSAWTNRFEIMSLAAHEFVHGAFGIGQHTEDFAAKLTDVMTVMLTNIKDFSPYYR